jgi:hypothetical protein
VVSIPLLCRIPVLPLGLGVTLEKHEARSDTQYGSKLLGYSQ